MADAEAKLTEGGHPIELAEGVEPLDASHGKRVVRVGGGTYVFELAPE